MMKFRIHWTVDGDDDFADIIGDTVKELQDKAESIRIVRGLDHEKNNMWSEEIK